MRIFLLLYMVFMARASGGGLGAHLLNKRGAVGDDGKGLGGIAPFNMTWVPEVFFCLPFSLIYFEFTWIGLLKAAVAFAVSYLAMQSSTGPALQWGNDPADGMARPRTLSPIVNWISDCLGFQRGDVNYCRTWMAVKGFLIGLPVGGVVLAVLWPLAYEVGHRFKNHAVSELLSGLGAAIALAAWVEIVHIVFN